MDRSAPTADEIRRQIQRARERVRTEADDVLQGARQLTDWRHYVRRYPWVTLGAAAVVGYVAVPRRGAVQSVEIDGRPIGQHSAGSGPAAVRPGPLASLVSVGGNMLLRTAIALAAQHAGRLYAEWTAPQTAEGPE